MKCARCSSNVTERDPEGDYQCHYCGHTNNRIILTEYVNHDTHRYPLHPRKPVVWSEERKQAARERLAYYGRLYNEQRKMRV